MLFVSAPQHRKRVVSGMTLNLEDLEVKDL